MKEEFYSKLVGSSTSAKIEAIFKNVEYYHYQFVHAKKRLDLFRKMPLLDLLFNHYKFYEDVFMIIGILLNILLFASLYRTNDDYEVVEEYSEDFEYDYGFLYKRENINITRNIFFYTTLVESIFAVIILLTYIITQYEISTTGDEYLISLMSNTRLSKDIIQVILKIFGVLILLYDLIYSNYIYYYSNNSHQVFYHYYSGFDVAKDTNDNCDNDNDSNNNNNFNDSNSEEGEDLLYEENHEINDDIRDNLFEFASQINSKKYKIKIIHSNNDDNNNTIFYLTNEIILCYIDTCIIIIFIITYETNIIMKLIYGLIIMFLNSRKYFILNEIKNNGQYFFYYLISFFFAIRLIILTNTNSVILNYLAHINVFILLVYYCCINKRNYFLSLILLIHLIVAYSHLKSNFIIFDIVSVLLFLLVKNLKSKKKYRIDKYEDQNNNMSLIFLLSLLGFFLVQLYGINKIFDLVQDIFNKITNFFDNLNFMMTYGKHKEKSGQPIEYYIITDFINWIDKK
jgi:hypothetical protein